MEINIPGRLKDLRAQYKFSQGQVAVGIGMKRGAYQAYEENRAAPPVTTLLKLSAFYGFYSLDLLLGIEKRQEQIVTDFMHAYHTVDFEKRKIVDFILNL